MRLRVPALQAMEALTEDDQLILHDWLFDWVEHGPPRDAALVDLAEKPRYRVRLPRSRIEVRYLVDEPHLLIEALRVVTS